MDIIIYILAIFGLFIRWFFISLICIVTGIVLSTVVEDSAIRKAEATAALKHEKEREDRRTKLIKPIE